jgi:cold shock CspA family protein
MAKSNSFNKREVEKNKQQKRKEKQQKREERKRNPTSSFDDMIAYVDEKGNITSTPPDIENKQKINIEDIVISTPKKDDTEETILRGRVEYYNSEKGYGFIKHDINGEKYFFHVSSAPNEIKEGNKVTFDLERGQRGMNAVKIIITNKDVQ